ncbi:MAG: hypothetical protein PUJ55_13865 [Clostridiales bacterium]|nr:hypothetical protein [Roseburia sp.]MDD7638008.1 hypothetical protein [Clostridiales bacterium]MDY4113527.1 DUF6715 family protein [Roseburia sp.]
MKQKTSRVIVAVLAIALIVGAYYYFAVYRSVSAEDNVELTEVQKVITKDLETNYPATPREVVKLYNRIQECFYNETYTDEELYALGDQARMLFDEELLENNPRDSYFSALKSDIADFQAKSKTIMSSDVCDSNDVHFQTVDGDECAYVTAAYFLDEDKSYSRTKQMYVLRKDEDGNWKILVFYRIEGDSSNE